VIQAKLDITKASVLIDTFLEIFADTSLRNRRFLHERRFKKEREREDICQTGKIASAV
jgi:hypothetical protein